MKASVCDSQKSDTKLSICSDNTKLVYNAPGWSDHDLSLIWLSASSPLLRPAASESDPDLSLFPFGT